MSGETIFEKVKDIIIKQLKVEESKIQPETLLVDDLGADSLDRVELVMALEDEFGVQIPDKDTETLVTVQAIVGYVEARL